jgi:hypothetical protein
MHSSFQKKSFHSFQAWFQSLQAALLKHTRVPSRMNVLVTFSKVLQQYRIEETFLRKFIKVRSRQTALEIAL